MKKPMVMNMRARQRAFTLLELIIVVAIIAILAAILIPNFIHARAESVTAACESNERRLAIAEEEYAVDHGGTYAAFAVLTTPYLRTMRVDPVKKGNRYTIAIPGGGANGAYIISDSGSHDITTTRRLQKTNGAICVACTAIVYTQNSGIHGK